MSKHILVNIKTAETPSTPLIGLQVSLLGLGSAVTGPDGIAEFFYRPSTLPVDTHRRMTLEVTDVAGRVVHILKTSNPFAPDKEGRVIIDDVDDERFPIHEIVIRDVEARGFPVTLGQEDPPALSNGNTVTVLVDREIFSHLAQLIAGLTNPHHDQDRSILVGQLTYHVPPLFNANPDGESPKVVFEFSNGQPPVANNLPDPVGVGDLRPERMLLQAADDGFEVRILLHSITVPLFVKIVAGILTFPFGGTDGLFSLLSVAEEHGSLPQVQDYFGQANHAKIKIHGFGSAVTNIGIMHSRLAIVDSHHGICMGASFAQDYVDTSEHLIDAPIRGNTDGLPNHDAAVSIIGPAVNDIHRTMSLLWTTSGSTDSFPSMTHISPPASAGENVCSVQIVRTLSEDTFADQEDGEKGILEMYLRAIAAADDFIYLENQYFTNCRIAKALIKVLKAKRNRPGKSDLQVILVLNIAPDMRFYPWKQRRLINCIRKEIGEDPQNPKQFAVFTRWTHETTGAASARMLPIYIHSKLGMVDDKWATVGSANLDGLSLDSYGLKGILNFLTPFVDPFGDMRAVEVNASLFGDAHGTEPSKVVELLRRKLWAEHLGLANPDAPEVVTRPPGSTPGQVGGWIKLWNDRANAALQHLRNNPAVPLTPDMARVLPWPPDNTTHKTPRDHLDALKIRTVFQAGVPGRVLALKSTRAFDFKKGDWKQGSKAKVDF